MNKPSHEYCKDCKDWNGSIGNCMEICSIPMNIIEEWEKYHAIGTSEQCCVAVKFKEYFDELYGNGLEVVNWHQNGDTEPFDNFYESALDRGDEK